MPPFPLANAAAWSLQLAIVVVAAGLVAALVRPGTPALRYAWWRLVAVACLLLPWLQPRRTPATVLGDEGGTDIATWLEASPLAGETVAGGAAPPLWSLALTVAVAGTILRLGWLALGARRLDRLRREGAAAPDTAHASLQQRLGTRADVRYLDAIDRPVTFGVRRPVVLLPSTLAASPVEIREAVLAHELWHVRRRDWAWLLVEELARAALWWHPACWWLVSRIQLAREEVVDALTVAFTGRRRAYLQALAGFSDPLPLHPAPAFAWRRHLFHRMQLVAREDTMSATRLVLSGAVVIAVVVAAGSFAVTQFPMTAAAQELRTAPGPIELAAHAVTPENPVPRRLHSVDPEPGLLPVPFGQARVTLRLTLDHAGVPAEVRFVSLSGQLAGMNVSLIGQHPATLDVERLAAQTSGTQAVDGQAITRTLEALVQSAVAAASQWRYDAPFNAPLAFDTTLSFGAGGTPEPAAGWTDGALRVGGNVAPPRKVKDQRPVYPADAKAAGIQGIVIAEVRIAPDGRVDRAHVVRSVPELDQAALDAIHGWEFTPTLMNGQPVPVVMTVTVQFALQQ
jgi:TonB family protein